MEDTARTDWDRRYSERSHHSLTPDPLLVSAYEEFIAPSFVQPGRALDLAGGVGRHAIFLAERGCDVTLLDISPTALEIAKSEANKRGLRISAEQADLTETSLPVASYDLILNFFYLERALFPQNSSRAQAGRPAGLQDLYPRAAPARRRTHPPHALAGEQRTAARFRRAARLALSRIDQRQSRRRAGGTEGMRGRYSRFAIR